MICHASFVIKPRPRVKPFAKATGVGIDRMQRPSHQHRPAHPFIGIDRVDLERRRYRSGHDHVSVRVGKAIHGVTEVSTSM